MAVKISTDVIEKFENEMWKTHTTGCMFLKLSDNRKEIILDKTFGAKELPYEEMLKEIPEDECRFIAYDHEVLANKPIKKVILINWSPPNEQVRRKMIYAAMKHDVKKSLTGCSDLVFNAENLRDLAKQSIEDTIRQKAGF